LSPRLSPEPVLHRYEWLPFGDSIRMPWCLLLLPLGPNLLLDRNRLGLLRGIKRVFGEKRQFNNEVQHLRKPTESRNTVIFNGCTLDFIGKLIKNGNSVTEKNLGVYASHYVLFYWIVGQMENPISQYCDK